MRIKFLGASGTVTGSSFLINNKVDKLLIDFGMFQGFEEINKLNFVPLAFGPSKLSAVLITHAHLDHVGRLPLLVKNGFLGRVYMTKATSELSLLALLDTAKIAKEELKEKALYNEEDVKSIFNNIEIIDYDREFIIGSFRITYRDAGHILGSSSIEIIDSLSGNLVIFSGDIGNFPEPLVKNTKMIDRGDFVVMESTYGDRTHVSENPIDIIQREINIVEKTSAILLVPAFSLERTQELLHIINHLKKDAKIKNETVVILDSPMAIAATLIYKKHKELYGKELFKHSNSEDPFDFPGMVMMEKHEESLKIKEINNPKVIIAGSGMMSGGRILNHAIDFLPNPKNRLLIVGYQAEDTLGRQILNGIKNIIIHGRELSIKAIINETQSMSAHADQPRLLKWLSHIKGVKKVFLIHGDDIPRKALEAKIRGMGSIDKVLLPNLYQEFEV